MFSSKVVDSGGGIELLEYTGHRLDVNVRR